jgi:hypothetical protein
MPHQSAVCDLLSFNPMGGFGPQTPSDNGDDTMLINRRERLLGSR